MKTDKTDKERSENLSFAETTYPILIGFGIMTALFASFFATKSSISLAIVSAGTLISGALLSLAVALINRH